MEAEVAPDKVRKLNYFKLRVHQFHYSHRELDMLKAAFREVGEEAQFVDFFEELLDRVPGEDWDVEDKWDYAEHHGNLFDYVQKGHVGTIEWLEGQFRKQCGDPLDEVEVILPALILGMIKQGGNPRAVIPFCLFGIYIDIDSGYCSGLIIDILMENDMGLSWEEERRILEGLLVGHSDDERIVKRLAFLIAKHRSGSIGQYWKQTAIKYPRSWAVAQQLSESWTGEENEIKRFWETMTTLLPDVACLSHSLAEAHARSGDLENAIGVWTDLLAVCESDYNARKRIIPKLHEALLASRGVTKTVSFWLAELERSSTWKELYITMKARWLGDACILLVKQNSLSLRTELQDLIQRAIVFCPDRHELVNLFRDFGGTFDELVMWERALNNTDSHFFSRWHKYRIAELHKPLRIVMPIETKQFLIEIGDTAFKRDYTRKLFEDVEDDVTFWHSLLELKASQFCVMKLVEAMKAKGYYQEEVENSLKSWVTHHVSASTANDQFLQEVDKHLKFADSVDGLERLLFWWSNSRHLDIGLRTCNLSLNLSDPDIVSCDRGITTWKRFFADVSVAQSRDDEVYEDIIQLYYRRVDLSDDDMGQLRTVWKDAQDFCWNELSKWDEPPYTLQKFYKEVLACIDALEG